MITLNYKKIGKRVKEMRNRKGFTLIELLAVITIMGILLLVSIPAVSRTIENTRRDTFVNTAKTYINAVKTAVAADEVYVGAEHISAKGTGYYYYGIDSSTTSGQDLVEQGGKSSWGNAEVKGYVVIHKTVTAANARTKYEYAIFLVDSAKRGITTVTLENALKRTSVVTTSSTAGKVSPTGTAADKLGSVTLQSGTVASGQTACTAVTIS